MSYELTPSEIEVSRAKLVELLSSDVVTLYNVDKVFTTWDELHASPEWIEMYSGWQGQKSAETRHKENLKLNYGFIINGNIYAEYEINEGFNIFGQLRVNSMLHNGGFNRCYYVPVTRQYVIEKQNWENCKANRKIFRDRKMTVTTEFHLYGKY